MPNTKNIVYKEKSLSVVLTPTIEDNWQKLQQIKVNSWQKQGIENFRVPIVQQYLHQNKNPAPVSCVD